jgi:hypothetical protein
MESYLSSACNALLVHVCSVYVYTVISLEKIVYNNEYVIFLMNE